MAAMKAETRPKALIQAPFGPSALGDLAGAAAAAARRGGRKNMSGRVRVLVSCRRLRNDADRAEGLDPGRCRAFGPGRPRRSRRSGLPAGDEGVGTAGELSVLMRRRIVASRWARRQGRRPSTMPPSGLRPGAAWPEPHRRATGDNCRANGTGGRGVHCSSSSVLLFRSFSFVICSFVLCEGITICWHLWLKAFRA